MAFGLQVIELEGRGRLQSQGIDKWLACFLSLDMLLPKIVLMYPILSKSTSKQINFELILVTTKH
jgi:hypothetical protein